MKLLKAGEDARQCFVRVTDDIAYFQPMTLHNSEIRTEVIKSTGSVVGLRAGILTCDRQIIILSGAFSCSEDTSVWK
jgi:hypothetical protein